MVTAPRKLGVLVAIPIKGRKLLNRSGKKQSPFVQLKLGADQKKRTKTSLIASLEPEWDQEVRLDVFQGILDMHVAVFDEGRKNELIGEGTLMLHEVIDKGELDVWFPIKNKGTPAGDVYFELTFYAMAPPPATGGGGRLGAPASHMQPMQHPGIRHTQPGFMPAGRPLPNTPPAAMYGHSPGPPAPYPGNTYQHPVGYNSSNSRPYPVPQQHPHIPSQSNNHPSYGTLQNRPAGYSQAFQPKTQYNSSPQMPPMAQQGGHSHQYPAGSIGNGPHRLQSSSNPSGRAPMPQHSPSGGRGSHPGHLPQMPVPHPTGHVSGPSHPSHGPSPGYGPGPPAPGLGNHFSRPPTHFPNNSHHDRRPPPSPASQVSSPRAVTPLVQYNYSLGSFP